MCLICNAHYSPNHPSSSHTCTCKKKFKAIRKEDYQEITIETNCMGLLNNNLPSSESLSDTFIRTCNSKSVLYEENGTDSTKIQKKTGSCSGMTVGDYESKTQILHLINGGSFGEIYLGECLSTQTDVAVKAEKQGSGMEKLLQEGNVYYKLQGGPGIPKVHWYGMHGLSYNFLVMELLGPNLAEIFHSRGERFTLSTVLKFQVEMLKVMSYIHGQNYIHRDISPDNFVIGTGENQSKVYLIDFGLAKKCNESGRLVLQGGHRRGSFSVKRPMVGTPRFASLGVHQGTAEGRRDDLESLAYVSIYFLKGSLPWQRSNSSIEKDRFAEIAESKTVVSPAELCQGLPSEFATFLVYVRSLKPSDTPDYSGLVTLFENVALQKNVDVKTIAYDWLSSHCS